MFAHLWTGGPMPEEYKDFILSDRFGWTPEEIDKQSAASILSYFTIMDVENRVERKRRGK
jgi:hypothetical protein